VKNVEIIGLTVITIACWTCWALRQRLVATWAEFQHSLVYYATDQCRKRLEACINAEGGHSKHLLWHCLPNIPVATHHNRFFSEPPMTTHNWLSSEPPTFEKTQQTFRQMKKFYNQKLLWRHFSGGLGKWTVCFLLRSVSMYESEVCMNNTVENDLFWFPISYIWQIRWTNL